MVDIIYAFGPDWGVIIMNKLETYENWLEGWSFNFDLWRTSGLGFGLGLVNQDKALTSGWFYDKGKGKDSD